MTLINEFLKCVEKYTNNTALISEEEGMLSYGQLAAYSNYIAGRLLKYKEFVPVIGILLPRSFDMIASMFGIMRTGMAYVPIDPSYPLERIRWMLQHSQTNVVICDSTTQNILDDSFEIITLEGKFGECMPNINMCKSEDMACILYTSGSTGMPNGVIMTHHSILNTIKWSIDYYELNENDIDMQVPSSSFTSSIVDIFSSLLSGGCLVMLNEGKLLNARYLEMISMKYKVTHFIMVPSLYKEYLYVLSKSISLRFVILAGEQLTYKVIKAHFDKLSHVKLVNEYGMAETCAGCFVKQIFNINQVGCIGRPISNMSYIIEDMDQEQIGELYVCGPGLAKGYNNNDELTNMKFVIKNNIRYVKTGDYVKKLENEDLFYIGRKDNQIKVNGKRVNLAEIDYILQKCDGVIDSVTTFIMYRSKQLIVSFIRSINGCSEEYYKKILKSKLPSHYIPNYIKIVDDFLYLPNKKIYIRGLKEMFIKELDMQIMKADANYKKLVEIIYEITGGLLVDPNPELPLEQQGIDSISYIRLLAEEEEKFEFEFGYSDVNDFDLTSIKALFEYVSKLKDVK